MRHLHQFRILGLFACVGLSACGGGTAVQPAVAAEDTSSSPSITPSGSPNADSAVPIPPGQVMAAVARLDELAAGLMARSGIPGMAVAVVHEGKTVYAKGFGVRAVGNHAPVDVNTVFQLASVSKSVGATVVAQQVSAGRVRWDMPVRSTLPWFALQSAYVSEQVTIGDLYAHRSGLPDHAGDKLEDLGYDRRQVLQRLRFVPLAPFRSSYFYTNFGLTAAAEAVAAASGMDWASLSQQAIYRPLGMTSTSSRYADFKAQPNRAVAHVPVNGVFVPGLERDPDAQSPAGGVSSSVSDMARWLTFLLAQGRFEGRQIVAQEALLPAISPQAISKEPATPDERASYYGYGFNVGSSSSGRVVISHSGAFALGAATSFLVIPSADVGIVVLTNAAPIGVPETLTAQFSDLVQLGRIQRDWESLARKAFAPLLKPVGSLVGVPRPTNPAPPQPLSAYTGTYRNDYYGPAQVVENAGKLELRLGPIPTVYPLAHWDGDVFTFMLHNENAPPGTISKASFSSGKVVLEYFDEEELGTFVRP